MKNKSLKRNFIYNFIFTLVNMAFPIVTAPYLSRVLGAFGIGRVNYATAVISWFILIAGFGIPRFAVREIARHREDRKRTSMIFWNMISIQAIFTVILAIIYIIVIINISDFHESLTLHLIMSLMLIFNIFTIDWFYQGIEEYAYISIRNTVVKTISVILIFVMVNNPEDYLLLGVVNIFALGLNNVLNYLNALKYIDRKMYEFKFLYYLKRLKVFFGISLVIALYTQLDQIFLGNLNEAHLAYFVRSKAILGIGLSLTSALVTVIAPRAAYLAYNDEENYRIMVQKSVNYIYLLGLPICGGLFLLAPEAMYFLGGDEFMNASTALKIMAPLSLIVTLGTWITGQVLVPSKLEEETFKIQVFAVFISIGLNFILIPRYSYIGATITWLIVETFLFLGKAIYVKLKCKDLNINYLNLSALKFLTSTMIMSTIIFMVKNMIDSHVVTLFVSIVVGAFIYIICLIFLKEELVLNGMNQILFKVRQK